MASDWRIGKEVQYLSPEEYQKLLDFQEGRCAICRCRPRSKKLAQDHNHQTGLIRGLCCARCNHGLLGHAHDDVVLLQRAADYLLDPPARRLFGGGVAPEA